MAISQAWKEATHHLPEKPGGSWAENISNMKQFRNGSDPDKSVDLDMVSGWEKCVLCEPLLIELPAKTGFKLDDK